jgi:hypothetical protein
MKTNRSSAVARRARLGALLALVLMIVVTEPNRAEVAPDAPYQVEGVVVLRDDHDRMGTGLGLQPPRVLIDLGSARDGRFPETPGLREVTIIGTEGAAEGTLEDIYKDCQFLCGDDAEECHFVGVVVLAGRLDTIGTPLIALAGKREISSFRPWAGTSGMPPAPPPRSVFSPALWSPYPDYAPGYRIESWDTTLRSLTLAMRDPSGEVHRLTGEQCDGAHDGELSSLSCSGFALLIAEGRPLLFSYPDYNLPAAEVVASFTQAGEAYHLVRYGAKAQTVFGLVTRGPEGWRALFRPKDYALLC